MAARGFARSVSASLQRLATAEAAQQQSAGALGAVAEALAQRCRLSTAASHLPAFGQCRPSLLPSSAAAVPTLHAGLFRWASSTPADDSKPKDAKESSSGAEASGEPAEAEASEAEHSAEEILAQLSEAKATESKLHEQVESLTDKLKRSLAEMENVRTRSAREVENAKKFGSQGIVKDLLDIPDNLERAAASVPADALEGSGGSEEEQKLRKLLKGLLEGVQATERIMQQVLRKQGVEQYNPLGDKFDPNLHSALFEVPDASKDAGLVAVVTKRGYKLHDRVIRPADVGVTRAP